jgi:DNA-binding winged helix-turn-helix (wHTH) protein
VSSTSGTDAPAETPGFEPSRRVVAIGLGTLVAILLVAGMFLVVALPDAGAFDARVERLFVENADLTSRVEIRLLEILAQSGTAFADTLASYRLVIFVLLLSSTALLVTSLAFLVILLNQSRRLRLMDRQGIRVKTLALERETRTVQINDMEFQLTAAAMETLSVLAEARIDGDLLSGAEIEAMITGRDPSDCDEGSGVTRIKRLRDALGGQMVAALLVRTVAKKGYSLAVEPQAISLR